MRLIKVLTPDENASAKVAEIAFASGIREVSISKLETRSADGTSEAKEAVDIQTSTPKAKKFVDALLEADFYDAEKFTVNTRQPRSIISKENLSELTYPLVEPPTDLLEELWQFSHPTKGFCGRVFIAACLLSFGLIHGQILIIIAGLLFLPLLPLLISIGFGSWTRQWKLVTQAAISFFIAIVLLICGGAIIAVFSQPPIKFDDFNSALAGFLISLAVGIAAALASTDDAGKRELIGLAATAQIAIIPAWFGVCFVFGFPATTGEKEITTRALMFFVNVATIIAASLATYILLGATNRSLAKVKSK